MQKIPTLYVRDPEDRRYVTPDVTPGCEWVLAGEGTATRKYDGTCVMYDGADWWARREVKKGKAAPDEYREVEYDPETGKSVGWEPIGQSAFAKWHADALARDAYDLGGTYELIGPKVNGNPERWPHHTLIAHADADRIDVDEVSFDYLRDRLRYLGDQGIEGIVWHHPDGRMAKLKARDFPKATP